MTLARGFISLGLILLVVIGLAALGGWAWWTRNHTRGLSTGTTASTTPNVSAESATTSTWTTIATVSGMRRYDDSGLGFSFWYPSSLTPTTTQELYATGFIYGNSGERVKKILQVGDVTITEVYAPSGLRVYADHGSPWSGSGAVTYYFDTSRKAWMAAWSGAGPNGKLSATTTADASHTTLGGYLVFGGSTYTDEHVVAYTPEYFLDIQDPTGNNEASLITSTIGTAGALADSTERISLIKNASAAFTKVFAPPSPITTKTYTDTRGFALTYPSDFALLGTFSNVQAHRVVSYMGACPIDKKGVTALCYVGADHPNGFEAASVVFAASSTESRTQCEHLSGGIVHSEGETSKAPAPAVINDITFYKDSWGDAGLGHGIGVDSYTTYHNGTCFTISREFEIDNGAENRGDTSVIEKELDAIVRSFRFTN